MVDLTASYMESATLTDTDGQFQVGGAITPNSQGSSVAFIWNGTAESAVQIHPPILAESYAYAIRDGRIAGTGSDFDFMQSPSSRWLSPVRSRGQLFRRRRIPPAA